MKFSSLTLVVLLFLQSCGSGTDVGNAVSFEVSLGSTDDSLSTALTANSIDEAMLSVRAIGLRPQTDCARSTPDAGAWKIQRENKILDYLSNSPSIFNIETNLSNLCQIRIVLGPALGGAHPGKSLYFTGEDRNGIPYTIESAEFHLLALKAEAGLQTAGVEQIRNLIYRSQVLENADFSALAENPVTISPSSHPAIFRIFLRQLRRAIRGFRLENKSASNPSAADAEAIGDEDLDTLLSGEQ